LEYIALVVFENDDTIGICQSEIINEGFCILLYPPHAECRVQVHTIKVDQVEYVFPIEGILIFILVPFTEFTEIQFCVFQFIL
jgi:hypothetical protein